MLGLEADAISLAVGASRSAGQRPGQRVAGIELHGRLGRQHCQRAATDGVPQECGPAQATAGDQEGMVVAKGADDLWVSDADPLADAMRGAEVEWSAGNGADFASRDAFGIDREELVGIDREIMAEDVAGALASQVEITVVGKVEDGGAIGLGMIVHMQGWAVQAVADTDMDSAGIAGVAVGAGQFERCVLRAMAGEGPWAFSEAIGTTVNSVRTCVLDELVDDVVQDEASVGDAAGIATGNGPEMRAVGNVVREVREAEDDIGAGSHAIRHLDRLQDRAEREGLYTQLSVVEGHAMHRFARGHVSEQFDHCVTVRCPSRLQSTVPCKPGDGQIPQRCITRPRERSSVMQVERVDGRSRANVARLAAAQALAGANATVVYATGAIIGSTLAPSPAMTTVPISVFVVGMAAGTLPAGWLARAYGRRAAFLAGSGCGFLAGLMGALALVLQSFAAFCVATFLAGLYGSVVQSFRFAAADGASPAFRPRALSWVMAGGVFAGVLGPQLVTWTMDLWSPHVFVVSYLAQAAVALVSMAVLAGVDLPPIPKMDVARGRPLGEIVRQPRFQVAVVCGIVSYTLMNLVMTSAPLAMRMCGLPLASSNMAIEWHVVAMYAPSFFTGALIARFGAHRVVAAGLVLLASAGIAGLTGITATHFVLGLVLLGLGWNFGFVGASALVLETHRPEERTRVQSLNDFLVFGTMAAGSFSSGGLLMTFGWASVNWVVFPPVVIALLFLGLSQVRRGVMP